MISLPLELAQSILDRLTDDEKTELALNPVGTIVERLPPGRMALRKSIAAKMEVDRRQWHRERDHTAQGVRCMFYRLHNSMCRVYAQMSVPGYSGPAYQVYVVGIESDYVQTRTHSLLLRVSDLTPISDWSDAEYETLKRFPTDDKVTFLDPCGFHVRAVLDPGALAASMTPVD